MEGLFSFHTFPQPTGQNGEYPHQPIGYYCSFRAGIILLSLCSANQLKSYNMENSNQQMKQNREEVRDAKTSNRGLASADPETRKAVARKGGVAVSKNREHMASIGRKGGQTVSQDRQHMSQIGRKGGEAVSRDRQHMSEIGRKGGENSRATVDQQGMPE